jgi:hypothetical protein
MQAMKYRHTHIRSFWKICPTFEKQKIQAKKCIVTHSNKIPQPLKIQTTKCRKKTKYTHSKEQEKTCKIQWHCIPPPLLPSRMHQFFKIEEYLIILCVALMN